MQTSVAEFDDLVDAARTASKQDRISFRDPIASYGQHAIQPMRRWLTDAELGAFAVRVLERIADTPADRRAVIEALSAVDPATVTEPVAHDIAAALARHGHATGRRAGAQATSTPAQWPGYTTASPLEQRFHDDMLDIFRLAGEATRKHGTDGTLIRGYWANYFLRGVRNHGGLAYDHQLLRAEGTTDGFARLTDEGRLDLTMEALVLRPEYQSLFPPTERQVAASRLARADYQPTPS